MNGRQPMDSVRPPDSGRKRENEYGKFLVVRTSGGSSAKASCLLEGTFLRWYRVSSAITSISIGLNPSKCSLFCAEQRQRALSNLTSKPELSSWDSEVAL